ncbi:hypothetical protein [Muricoccus radiodurans]|uniref:hypothetical protein n=1 Tax=Muricoccus radiodurans TaxID=2231721 RepID=UPI003CF942E7
MRPFLTLLALAAAIAGPAAAQQTHVTPGGTTVLVFPPGTAVPGGGAPSAAPAPAPGTPLRATASIVGPGNNGRTQVTAEVLSLTREARTLMLRVRMLNEGGVNANSVAMHLALSEASIVDPTTQRRAGVMKAPSGAVLATDMAASGVPAGGQRELFVQFPEPPPNVTRVNLYLRGFPPIMDVPIQP